jgi:antitoxin (DNA-binding transcriptional repressor) of toxin-antitoxin stability system
VHVSTSRWSGHLRGTGARELKQSLSETLHAVGNGEQIGVTLDGRPLADIVPACNRSDEGLLSELVASPAVSFTVTQSAGATAPLARWRLSSVTGWAVRKLGSATGLGYVETQRAPCRCLVHIAVECPHGAKSGCAR